MIDLGRDNDDDNKLDEDNLPSQSGPPRGSEGDGAIIRTIKEP